MISGAIGGIRSGRRPRKALAGCATHRPRMPARARRNVAPVRRMGVQRPMRARMRFLLAAVLDELGCRLVALARRDARVVRRLGRTIQLRPQFGDLRLERPHIRAQPLDRIRLRQGDAKKPFPIKRFERAAIHPYQESETDSRIKSAKEDVSNYFWVCRRSTSPYAFARDAKSWRPNVSLSRSAHHSGPRKDRSAPDDEERNLSL